MALEIPRFEFERGETVRRHLTVTLPGGGAKDLTGAVIAWNLVAPDGAKVFSPDKTVGAGVGFVGAASLGVPQVTMSAVESAQLSAFTAYVQEWVITDGVGDTQIYRGQAFCNAAAIPAVA